MKSSIQFSSRLFLMFCCKVTSRIRSYLYKNSIKFKVLKIHFRRCMPFTVAYKVQISPLMSASVNSGFLSRKGLYTSGKLMNSSLEYSLTFSFSIDFFSFSSAFFSAFCNVGFIRMGNGFRSNVLKPMLHPKNLIL